MPKLIDLSLTDNMTDEELEEYFKAPSVPADDPMYLEPWIVSPLGRARPVMTAADEAEYDRIRARQTDLTDHAAERPRPAAPAVPSRLPLPRRA